MVNNKLLEIKFSIQRSTIFCFGGPREAFSGGQEKGLGKEWHFNIIKQWRTELSPLVNNDLDLLIFSIFGQN